MKIKIKSTGQLCYMFDNNTSGIHSKVLIPYGKRVNSGALGQIAVVKSSNLVEVANFTG